MEAWDDISGEASSPKEVAKARREELDFYQSMGAYKVVDRSEAWRVTGKGQVGVRWIDHNKGDKLHLNIRSRLVAKDFKVKGEDALYAGTPPLECLKLVISHAVAGG